MVKNTTLFLLLSLMKISSLFSQFGPQQIIQPDFNGITKITSADIDNDGWQDLLISQKHGEPGSEVLLYHNLGNNTFQKQQILSEALYQPPAIETGDLNGDGFDDVLTSSSSLQSRLLWIPNNGGSLTSPINIDSSLFVVIDFKIEDLDNDGDMDIALITDTNFILYINDGNAHFQKMLVPSGINTENYDLILSDLDGDGFKDAIIGGVKTLIYKNTNGVLSYDEDRSNSIVNQGLVTLLATADADNDGDTDIFILGNSLSDLRWYANDGNGFFSLQQIILDNVAQQHTLSLNDLDGDGDADIATTFPQTGLVAWFENLGNGLFGSLQQISQGSIPHTKQVHTTDLDNDGLPDLIWSDPLSFHLNTLSVGVKNPQPESNLIIKPNPSNQGALSLSTKAQGLLSIYNSSGQLLYDKLPLMKGENTFELSLQPGVYFLLFQNKNSSGTQKLLVR